VNRKKEANFVEWLYLLMPISGVEIFWPGMVILGLGAGVMGGFYGIGAAWMITPGLNVLGFPMAFAIGTDIAHIAGKSIVSTIRHGKFGNVDYPLGIAMLGGTVIGIEVGAQMIMWFERIGKIDLYVRLIYLVLLSFIMYMIVSDAIKIKKKRRLAKEKGVELAKLESGITWYKTMHKIQIPPRIHFKQAQITVSLWLPLIVGLVTGWVAGILGIGGGLIRMPALIYFVGCPTHVAIGTDLFEVMLSGLYGTFTYTWKGRTEILGAIIMLFGAAFGAQFGAVATKYYKGGRIRLLFGAAVFVAAISIIWKLFARAYDIVWMDYASIITILGGVSILMFIIVYQAIRGMIKEVRMKKAGLPK